MDKAFWGTILVGLIFIVLGGYAFLKTYYENRRIKFKFTVDNLVGFVSSGVCFIFGLVLVGLAFLN